MNVIETINFKIKENIDMVSQSKIGLMMGRTLKLNPILSCLGLISAIALTLILYAKSNQSSKNPNDDSKNNLDQLPEVPNVVSSEPIKSPEQKIIEDFSEELVSILGGAENVLKFPDIAWDSSMTIPFQSLKAPIMKGYTPTKEPFLVFCYMFYTQHEEKTSEGEYKIINQYEIIGEHLICSKIDGSFSSKYNFKYQNHLTLASQRIAKDSDKEKEMLDKIKRLINFEAIGKLEAVCFDYIEIPPTDGMTGLFLYDPSKSEEDNLEALKNKFPNMPLSDNQHLFTD